MTDSWTSLLPLALVAVASSFYLFTRMSSASSDDEVQASSDPQMAEMETNLLRQNIKSKGANSYYYAHATKIAALTVKDDPPQLVANHAVHVLKPKTKTCEKFAWADGNKVVSLYIEHPNAEELGDERIVIISGLKSIEIRIEDNDPSGSGVPMVLKIMKLNGEIDGATFKRKTGKIVVLLKKKMVRSWSKLEE